MGDRASISWTMLNNYWSLCWPIHYGSMSLIFNLSFVLIFLKMCKKGFTKINVKRWIRIIITRCISIVPCVIVTMSSYNSLDNLNFWCNIVQSIQIPFALFPILHFTSSKRIMGSFRNNFLLKIVCCLISLCVLGVNVFFLVNLIVIFLKKNSYNFKGSDNHFFYCLKD